MRIFLENVSPTPELNLDGKDFDQILRGTNTLWYWTIQFYFWWQSPASKWADGAKRVHIQTRSEKLSMRVSELFEQNNAIFWGICGCFAFISLYFVRFHCDLFYLLFFFIWSHNSHTKRRSRSGSSARMIERILIMENLQSI